jgi:two-component system, chemotaxis family, chemotaxis protein CheY
MPKRVLDVGQCGPDHATIRRFLNKHFDVQVDRADGPSDTLAALRAAPYDLVLINRKLDRDYSDGIEIIKQIKSDPSLASAPVMLVTNFPEHQQAAVDLGAARGFGKLEYGKPETLQRLSAILADQPTG